MKIVLFDIDGTLLLSDGAGRRAMERALVETFGVAGPKSYRYGGKTDRLIVREKMRLEGFDDAAIDAAVDATVRAYLRNLQREIDADPAALRALPGVFALLEAVEAHEGLVLGLLTGNVVAGADLKLRAVQIDPARFRVGAFGSDHEQRPMLPPIAQARASALLGRDIGGDRLIIIGDTEHDMTCGQGVGAKAIGVATGGVPRATLEAHAPVTVFDDFADTARVLEAILDA
jgi:phosphoglycolate phosphatase-like HAD superfamily hydrolase